MIVEKGRSGEQDKNGILSCKWHQNDKKKSQGLLKREGNNFISILGGTILQRVPMLHNMVVFLKSKVLFQTR